MLIAAGHYHPRRHHAWQLRHTLMLINALISEKRITKWPDSHILPADAEVLTRLFTKPEDIVRLVVGYL